MILKNATNKQKEILKRLEPCRNALSTLQFKVKVVLEQEGWTDEYRNKQINELMNECKANYFNCLDEVKADLESKVKGKVNWVERSDAQQLYDALLFKEILGTGDAKAVCESVEGNLLNKTYVDYFSVNYNRLLAEARATDGLKHFDKINATKERIDALGVDQEIQEILNNLNDVSHIDSMFLGLDNAEQEVAAVTTVHGVTIPGKMSAAMGI